MSVLVITMLVLAGLFTGGALSLRRQGRPMSVVLVPAVVAAILLGLAMLLGAFG